MMLFKSFRLFIMKSSILRFKTVYPMIVMCLFLAQNAKGQLPRDTFFQHMAQLEGRAFRGMVCAAPEGDTTFTGKSIILHGSAFRNDSVFLHLLVGEDRSRNWIVVRSTHSLELRHIHRHQDGTLDAITDYGGMTTNPGTGVVQFFPADDRTHQVILAAAGNVWWMEFTSDHHFRYHLRRLGTERYFCLSFDLSSSIPIPPTAW